DPPGSNLHRDRTACASEALDRQPLAGPALHRLAGQGRGRDPLQIEIEAQVDVLAGDRLAVGRQGLERRGRGIDDLAAERVDDPRALAEPTTKIVLPLPLDPGHADPIAGPIVAVARVL